MISERYAGSKVHFATFGLPAPTLFLQIIFKSLIHTLGLERLLIVDSR